MRKHPKIEVKMNSKLFSPIRFRDLEVKNRIFMAPMCQYSAVDGMANDWHKIHLATRAVGGVGLVIVEATGVVPEGRITDQCLGIYNNEQVSAFKDLTRMVKSQGAQVGIQLAHSGRKGTGSFEVVAPSAISFSTTGSYKTPKELSTADIEKLVDAFESGARNALEAGFDLVEIHMAHGYLLHQFLSPYSNRRNDMYGGVLENRMRFPLAVAKRVRDFWPSEKPVFVRLSATDWIGKEGLEVEEVVLFVKELKKLGLDFIDVSTGGNVSDAIIPVAPNYQVFFAEKIKREAGIPTGAVGLITEANQAEKILQESQADAIFLGRVLLRDPYWAIHAAQILKEPVAVPKQYARAFSY